MLKGKNCLVAGGAGFVGTNLIGRLLYEGASVRATVHVKPPQIKDDRVEFIKTDLTMPEDCSKAVKDMDIVFMCSANTSGAAVMEKTPLVHVTPNVIMNTLMLEKSYEAGVGKFLFLSSNTVYPVSDMPMKEDEATGEMFEKYFCVGWMKRFSEIMCRMYSEKIKRPMPSLVIRPANIYGPYDDFEWETSHVIPALIRKVVERHDPVEVWGDGKDVKDLIYIDDFIEGLIAAAEKLNGYDPVNIATGRGVSIRDALNIIIDADGYSDARISFNASKPTMIPFRLLDTSKAKNLLGFEAATSIEEGLKRTVKWYREERSV